LLAAYSDQTLAVCVYGLNIIACSLTLIAVWLYATWGDANLSPEAKRTTTLRLSINPVVCIVALGVAFMSTKIAILLFVATPVWYIITGPERTAAEPGSLPFQPS
jgi:hypothetical protein